MTVKCNVSLTPPSSLWVPWRQDLCLIYLSFLSICRDTQRIQGALEFIKESLKPGAEVTSEKTQHGRPFDMTICVLQATPSSILVAGGGKAVRAGLTT